MAAGARFRPRTIPGSDAASYVTRTLSSVTYRYEARVTYRAPAAEVRRRMPWASDAVQALDERSCLHRTSDDDLDWLAFRIGMVGVDFEVDGPPELLEHLAMLGRRFARAAASAPAADA